VHPGKKDDTERERAGTKSSVQYLPPLYLTIVAEPTESESLPRALLSDFSYAIFSERDTIRKGKKKRVVVGFQSALERIKALRKCVIFGH
jgi:hypothetical protein